MKGFVYLASPYSNPDPIIREARYIATAEVLMTMLKNGIWTFSPIVHCHELSKTWQMPSDAEFWKAYDRAMIDAAASVSVLMLRGWEQSLGVKDEIEYSISRGKQLNYITGATDVEAFLKSYPNTTKSSA